MGSAFHQLCPRYSGTLTPTAPTAIKLWDTFTFYLYFYTVELQWLEHLQDHGNMSRQGLFELVSVHHSARPGGTIGISFRISLTWGICCLF